MAGIYIHIPFCASRCIYCAFYSTTSLQHRQQYVDAVCREAEIRVNHGDRLLDPSLGHEPVPVIHTIYLGGGTPSQLSLPQLRQLFDALYIYNKVAEDAEVTMEVNPDDVSPEFAEGLRGLPVNRVSMGAQTFDDNRLRWLRRRHTAKQVSEAVNKLRQAGIGNISIDLMYGFPEETLDDWEHDINAALSLNVEHISAYCLSIEEGTPLYRQNLQDLDEELERSMYYRLKDRLEAAGYEHYEISNFSRPGFHSRHNSSYWNGTPYIGLGAAAHSYDGHCRSWNISDINLYIKGINEGHPHYDFERLDSDTQYNDLLTISLRTREGLDLNALTPPHLAYCLRAAEPYIKSGLLATTANNHLLLTRNGLFVSDMIISDLMLVLS